MLSLCRASFLMWFFQLFDINEKKYTWNPDAFLF